MKSLKEKFVGRKVLQPIFERLFRISLRGMNYGLGGMHEASGEIQLIKFVKSQLEGIYGEDEKVIFDVGANVGTYAEILFDNFYKKDQIHCFEPSKFCFADLSNLFSSKNNMRLLNFGLGSEKETRKLFYDSEGSGWASVFERGNTGFNHHLDKSENIEIVRLEDYCSDNAIDRIHFMKVDVEGFELEVFKGAGEMLSKIDFIQFEFSFANFNSRTYLYEFFEILSEFKIYRVLKDGIFELNYDPRYEILMTTNYLAVNRKIVR